MSHSLKSDRELTASLIQDYNATRQTGHTEVLCHFPWTTINFQQNGQATACCYNRTHVLGTYPQDSVEEMWYGSKATKLRRYLERSDLSHGCRACKDQLLARNFSGVLARNGDGFAMDPETRSELTAGAVSPSPPKLSVFEFELQNTCNLECVMCSGEFSSSIRKNREGLPPKPSPYDSAFVDQLIPFLPDLRFARFLGGEPFLIRIYHEIWEAMVTHRPGLEVSITTNGTILKPHTKRILEGLTPHLVVSIDSMTKATYEQIRVNADFDTVLENIRYFQDLVGRKETTITLAVCPMTVNWQDMPAIVAFCNREGMRVYFNTVLWPLNFSLRCFHDLDRVERELSEIEFPERTDLEGANRDAYLGLINQVRFWRLQWLPPALSIRRKRPAGTAALQAGE